MMLRFTKKPTRDQKQRGRKDEIPVQGNHRSSFLANTTAPINAISINNDVSQTEEGNR